MDPFAANESPVAGDTQILDRYPQPLARAWQRVLIASPRPAFHHQQLLFMAECLAYYLGAVAVSAYEQAQAAGGAPDPALNRSLRNLRRVTLGQWLGWTRAGLVAVPDAAALLPGLRAAYDAPDSGMLLLGYEGLRALMVVQLGYTGEYGAREAASPRLMLELISQYRIRRANTPAVRDPGFDEMAAVSVLAPGLRAALGRLALLAAYPLLGLARTPAGVVVLRLQGLTASESTVEIDPDAEPPGTLLLANPDELPMLVLDPWLIYAECPVCGQVQIAALAGQTAAARDYHGLDCEHTWAQAPGVVLAQVEIADAPAGGTEAGWTPNAAGFPAEPPTDQQSLLFAQLEADAVRLTAERAGRARTAAPASPPALAPDAAPAHDRPEDVYLDLLEERAAGGLTLDQLQALDEERAAAADRQRREGESA